ncbi:MAG: carbon-nitrogen hydrolase family protein [Planctomycetota bacterium]|nr:carbon-nitrogen hydrolase family protein [Planctomycetota bacterium]
MSTISLAVMAAVAVAFAAAAEVPGNLLANGDFTAAGAGDLPAGWAAWRPLWDHAACTVRKADGGLRVESAQEPFGVGGAVQAVAGIRGGQAYRVQAAAELKAITAPLRSVMVRLQWTRAGKPLTPHGWIVRGPVMTGSAAAFDDVLIAPAEADGATVQLEVKWPQGGSVLWRNARLVPCPAPAPRKVKLGAVYLKPQNSTPEKNLDLWCEQIDAAGKLHLDAVCLGEDILAVGTGRNLRDLAEPIPGPTSERLAAVARRNQLWVVAGLSEREGPRAYNTAILLDREGRLAGKYRKTHLPREEWMKGITPGAEYPVFQTDFGPVAIQICYDWFFPEVAEAFALGGARVLFAPTWGTTFPDQDGRAEGETVFRVRARDNGLALVACVYDGSSLVIDPLGRVLASKKEQPGLAWAEVDLASREPLFWVGHWSEVGPRDRMPETYGPLVAPATLPAKP